MIVFYKLDDLGSFVDYVYYDEERIRRVISELNFWYFKIEVFGRLFYFNVIKVMFKIIVGVVVEIVDYSGKFIYKEVLCGVYYIGYVMLELELLVVISGNKGLVSFEFGFCVSVDVKVCKISILILK